MHISPGDAKILSFLIFGVIRLLLCFGIAVFAVIAAWRHSLAGLWVLAAATAIAFVEAIVTTLLSSPWRSESIMRYVNLMSYLSYATIITAFIGWCILAFSRKK
jgi:hypothetical protein